MLQCQYCTIYHMLRKICTFITFLFYYYPPLCTLDVQLSFPTAVYSCEIPDANVADCDNVPEFGMPFI